MLRNQRYNFRADSRLAPSQWETSLQSNAVSYWLGANLESALNVFSQQTRVVYVPSCLVIGYTRIFHLVDISFSVALGKVEFRSDLDPTTDTMEVRVCHLWVFVWGWGWGWGWGLVVVGEMTVVMGLFFYCDSIFHKFTTNIPCHGLMGELGDTHVL